MWVPSLARNAADVGALLDVKVNPREAIRCAEADLKSRWNEEYVSSSSDSVQ